MAKRALIKELFGSDSEESSEEEERKRKRTWREEERRPPPKPGTTVQRSDREQARKAAIFLATPPRARGPPATAPRRQRTGTSAPPGRVRQPTPSTATRPGTAPPTSVAIPVCAAATRPTADPTLSPPVLVHLPDGGTSEVPHYAAHKSRKFHVRTATGRWLVRFDHLGRQRSCRRLPDHIPP
ncbi:hypothetical protein CAJAP_08870 [Camponotus japonicus]